jgi:hypothetical protein
VSGTGWTWQHVMQHCDLPIYFALCDWWHAVPPPAVQLRRIAQFLGIKDQAQPGTARMSAASTQPSSAQEVAMAGALAGLPVFEGRPNDPMLDLIPPPPAGDF